MQSMRSRLILSHMLPVLIATPVMAIALIYVLETRVVLVNLSMSLVRQAVLLAEMTRDFPMMWTDATAAQAFVNRFQTTLTAEVMILDSTGRLLASSDAEDAALLSQPLTLPGLTEVQQGQTSVRVNYSQDLRAEVADVLLPVFDSNQQLVGMIRVTQLFATIQERFWRLRYFTLTVVVSSLALGLVLGIFLAISLERPLEHLTRAIYYMVNGQTLTPLLEQGPTEIRLLLRAFNTLVERLRSLEAARRRLLTNLIHEIRGPLGALHSAVHALVRGASEDVALRTELLTGIQAELTRLRRLMDDLSLLYEQTLGTLELDLQPVDVREWLTTILPPWREAAQQKALSWQTTLPDPAVILQMDADRMAQAVGNLLSNAIKYTPTGGVISVTTNVTARCVCLQVSDTGPGISPQEQREIFEPYYRSRAYRRFPQGMGLGLTIARELVVAHGGQLEVESTVGAGSHFTIRLPVASSTPQEVAHQ
jgi:two-component system, OmpR family, sensor histidine kinase BaeS